MKEDLANLRDLMETLAGGSRLELARKRITGRLRYVRRRLHRRERLERSGRKLDARRFDS